MSLIGRVRALCLALPWAFELDTWEHPTFRVGSGRRRIFCTAAPDGSITLKADPLERDVLLAAGDGDRFLIPPYVVPRAGSACARTTRTPTGRKSRN